MKGGKKVRKEGRKEGKDPPPPPPQVRIFPKLMSWNATGRKYFSFADCSFTVKRARETTARVVVARELGIPNSYTLESTFAGANFGPLKDYHFNGDHFQDVGRALCDTLLDYYLPNASQRETFAQAVMAKAASSSLPRASLGMMPSPGGGGGGGFGSGPSRDPTREREREMGLGLGVGVRAEAQARERQERLSLSANGPSATRLH